VVRPRPVAEAVDRRVALAAHALGRAVAAGVARRELGVAGLDARRGDARERREVAAVLVRSEARGATHARGHAAVGVDRGVAPLTEALGRAVAASVERHERRVRAAHGHGAEALVGRAVAVVVGAVARLGGRRAGGAARERAHHAGLGARAAGARALAHERLVDVAVAVVVGAVARLRAAGRRAAALPAPSLAGLGALAARVLARAGLSLVALAIRIRRVPEGLARDERERELAEPVAAEAERTLELAHRGQLALGLEVADAEAEHAAREARTHLRGAGEVVAEPIRAAERLPVHLDVRVDRQRVLLGAVATDRVEVLEREARRIDRLVARGARRIRDVSRQAHPLRHRRAVVLGQLGHARGGRRDVSAEHVRDDELPAPHGRADRRVRVRREDRASAEEAAAVRAGGQRGAHAPPRARIRQPVERRELGVDEGHVRREELAHVGVTIPHVTDQLLDLRAHRGAQRGRPLGEELRVLLDAVESLEREELGEEADHLCARSIVLDHVDRGLAHALLAREIAARRAREQPIVGRPAPEEIREAARHLEARVAEARRLVGIGFADLHAEEEVRRLEEGRGHVAHRTPRIAHDPGELVVELDHRGGLFGAERAPPRHAAEARHEAAHALVARGDVAAVEGHARLGRLDRRGGQLERRLLVLLGRHRVDRQLARADGREAVERRVAGQARGVRQRVAGEERLEARAVLGRGEPVHRGRRRRDGRELGAGACRPRVELPGAAYEPHHDRGDARGRGAGSWESLEDHALVPLVRPAAFCAEHTGCLTLLTKREPPHGALLRGRAAGRCSRT
jgi:hypothetical protein